MRNKIREIIRNGRLGIREAEEVTEEIIQLLVEELKGMKKQCKDLCRTRRSDFLTYTGDCTCGAWEYNKEISNVQEWLKNEDS